MQVGSRSNVTMHVRRIGIRFVPLLLTAGCGTSTECDCIAPTVVVAGSVTGAASPVRIEARTAPSPCRDDATAAGSNNITDTQSDGTYRVGVPLPSPGPACVVVTATKFSDRPVTVTRRVEATVTKMPVTGPQEIRVDVAFTP
jgi:hypothetical protein